MELWGLNTHTHTCTQTSCLAYRQCSWNMAGAFIPANSSDTTFLFLSLSTQLSWLASGEWIWFIIYLWITSYFWEKVAGLGNSSVLLWSLIILHYYFNHFIYLKGKGIEQVRDRGRRRAGGGGTERKRERRREIQLLFCLFTPQMSITAAAEVRAQELHLSLQWGCRGPNT